MQISNVPDATSSFVCPSFVAVSQTINCTLTPRRNSIPIATVGSYYTPSVIQPNGDSVLTPPLVTLGAAMPIGAGSQLTFSITGGTTAMALRVSDGVSSTLLDIAVINNTPVSPSVVWFRTEQASGSFVVNTTLTLYMYFSTSVVSIATPWVSFQNLSGLASYVAGNGTNYWTFSFLMLPLINGRRMQVEVASVSDVFREVATNAVVDVSKLPRLANTRTLIASSVPDRTSSMLCASYLLTSGASTTCTIQARYNSAPFLVSAGEFSLSLSDNSAGTVSAVTPIATFIAPNFGTNFSFVFTASSTWCGSVSLSDGVSLQSVSFVIQTASSLADQAAGRALNFTYLSLVPLRRTLRVPLSLRSLDTTVPFFSFSQLLVSDQGAGGNVSVTAVDRSTAGQPAAQLVAQMAMIYYTPAVTGPANVSVYLRYTAAAPWIRYHSLRVEVYDIPDNTSSWSCDPIYLIGPSLNCTFVPRRANVTIRSHTSVFSFLVNQVSLPAISTTQYQNVYGLLQLTQASPFGTVFYFNYAPSLDGFHTLSDANSGTSITVVSGSQPESVLVGCPYVIS
eukprot:TRINITY_DN5994_c0_g1_i16.p1 TRINITY_DN5994_c0_g1~~TRINITY_DN5994_c0_g1_i16.p1  ORF type:complete len:565 (+),score=187.02 TRINITY_DN5994_c0_g1_i16:487-2181(+)